MSEYQRFDESGAGSKDVAQLDITSQSNAGESVGDVRITVDKQTEAENGGTLTIYKTEQNSSMEYIEDPGAKEAAASGVGNLRLQVKKLVEHIAFRGLTVVLILLDLSLVITDLAKNGCGNGDALEVISHIIISYFMLELAARIFYQGIEFFRQYLELIDGIIVVASFIVDMTFVGIAAHTSCGANYAKLLVIGRGFRIARIGRILYLMVTQRRHVATATRHVVSQNKRRYQRDGFDLDLCYITERVIAMSFPSKGLMSMYRNDINEVARFFNTKHKGHYRIYNLCSERDYDETKFKNQVERIFIDDHNVPKLKEMVWYSENVREWMAKDPDNIIAVHCKGGKGRTGTMICTWLVDCGLFEEAQDSLEYFGDRRTDLSVGKKFQGVETPSQSRYVGYYEKVKKDLNGELPPPTKKKITSVKIEGLTGVGRGDGTDLSMEIRADGLLIYECRFGENVNCELLKYPDTDSIVVNLQNCPVLVDDIKLRFFSTSKNIPQVYDHCAFFLWFHTYFIEKNTLYLRRDEIDNPHKKQAQKVFRENFAIELKFEDIQE